MEPECWPEDSGMDMSFMLRKDPRHCAWSFSRNVPTFMRCGVTLVLQMRELRLREVK